MDQYFEIFSQCPLFAGIERKELSAMLGCLGATTTRLAKGETLFLEGDPAEFVGIVLSGAVQIVRDDYYGNRSVLTVAQPGELFVEEYACAGIDTLPVSAFALKKSEVMRIDCRRILNMCSNACRFHSRMIHNLLQAVTLKSLALNQKIQYMSRRTTRDKLMAYLLDEAKQNNSPEFTIAYDRQSLADYLGVERSAMSAEISKLKKDGLLDSKGSWFCIQAPVDDD